MRAAAIVLVALSLTACSRSAAGPTQPTPRTAGGFPAPDRSVAQIVSPVWSSGPDRDAADESGQLIRALEIGPGMAVADIGAGAGYHTLRLSPVVGPAGVVYAEDIVEAYISGVRREARRRGLTNVKIVIGAPDDPRLPAAALDRALLVHMYHEIANPYALLWNLAPSMKPDGLVAVVDLDRPPEQHGMPPALLRCEFEAVGYRLVRLERLSEGLGYLAVFRPPTAEDRPPPGQIEACAV